MYACTAGQPARRCAVGCRGHRSLSGSFAGSATDSAFAHSYDVPAIARVEVRVSEAAEASLALRSDGWEQSASPSVGVQGTPTTPLAPVVATNRLATGGLLRKVRAIMLA